MLNRVLDLFPGYDKPRQLVPFVQRCEWAVFDPIPAFAERYGPVKVRLQTFNVNEEALRTLFFCEDIAELDMLLDMNVKRHKLDLLLFAASISPNIRVDSTHAKILLMENDWHQFGIVGSANLNRANRYEAGFWFTDRDIYNYFSTQFDAIFSKALPYDSTDLR